MAPLIAALLSIPAGDRYLPLDLSPQEHKQETLHALVRMFEGLTAQHPVLFVFEDAHWVDPTTRELMDLLIDRAAALPALILVTHRPEFETVWASHAHCTALALNRLGRETCAELIGDLTEGLALPDEVFEPILSKTDGVPLFIEELTKTVLESGLLTRRTIATSSVGPCPPLRYRRPCKTR